MKPQPLDKIYISNTIDEEDLEEATPEKIKLFEDCVGEKPLLICKLEDIKSACEFYLRYKDDPFMLGKEQPKYLKELEKFGYKIIDKETAEISSKYDPQKYNEWLFILAFRSVIKCQH